VTLLTTKNPEAWRDVRLLFNSHGLDDIYFHPGYISLYADSDSQVEAFLYKESSETFFFPYIKRRVSTTDADIYDFETAYGYGGPVATSLSQGFLESAWQAFLSYGRSCGIFAGLIRFHPLFQNQKFADTPSIEIQFVRQTVMMTLDSTEEIIWSRYKQDARKNVNKAVKNSVEIQLTEGPKALQQFARLYAQTMNDVSADEFYRFGDDYFQRIGEKLDGYYKVFLAHHDGKQIGGALTLNGDNLVHLHLSATDKGTRHFGTASLLRHSAIMANLHNMTTFHFGGGVTNQPDDSLLRFKQAFSTEHCQYHIGKVTVDSAVYREVCAKWDEANPDKKDRYDSIFLKYRF